MKNLYIITGGSKGLGLSLAEQLSQNEQFVAVIARSKASSSKLAKGLKNFAVDLSETLNFDSLVEEVFSQFDLSQINKAILVNNAGMIEPVANVESLNSQEVFSNVAVNLSAPMSLTSSFLKLSTQNKLKRVVVNVSSGVAKSPIIGWAAYSAAKAGLENFSQNLINEFAEDEKTRIINFNPGVIDTGMQKQIRSSRVEDFPDVEKFKSFKEDRVLRSPDVVASALISVLVEEKLTGQSHVSISELVD